MKRENSARERAGPARTLVLGLLGIGLWWLLAGGKAESWLVGLPAVAIFTALARRRFPGRFSVSLRGLVRFLPFFLIQSYRGGFDVSRRALQPRLALEPGLLAYPLRLPDGAPRTLFVNTISLLPGTLSWSVDDRSVHVHVLRRNADTVRELSALEQRIAGLFGLALPEEQP
jgi:multicomponent Na+:H+ antiporter subunit E